MLRFCVRMEMALAFALAIFGILILSYAGKAQAGAEPLRYCVMQAAFLAVSLVAMGGLFRVDYRFFARKEVLWALAVGMVVALALVLTPGVGKTVKGAHRWIGLGPINVQPVEFVKLGIVLFLSGYLGRLGGMARRLKWGVAVPGALVGPVLVLLALQPDFGGAMIVCALVAMVLLAGGVRLRHLLLPGAAGVAFVAAMLLTNENRMARLLNEQQGENYQAWQSEIAFHNGGLTGVGLGHGMQTAGYLPECHTDFIFAIIGEDLGLVATGLIWLAFLLMLCGGTVIALRAKDRQGMLLAAGATAILCAQGAANMAVVTHLLPTKGLALPFLSYGGSCLLSSFCAVGVLTGVGRATLEAEDAPAAPGGRPVSLG